MIAKPIEKPEDAFLPIVGQLAWSVRRAHGTFLTMEFGSPHLIVREPIAASSAASAKVRRNLARRRVSIVGDWHFWVKYAQWEMRTASCSMSSRDAEVALIEEALGELDGQILSSVSGGTVLSSCVLRFDLGGLLHIWPMPEIDDDQWSIHEAGGRIISCDPNGRIITNDTQG